MDVLTHLFHEDSCDIHLNHADLMDAIWSWIGIKAEQIQKVAEVKFSAKCLYNFVLLSSNITDKFSLYMDEASLYDGFATPTIVTKKIEVGGHKTSASAGLESY